MTGSSALLVQCVRLWACLPAAPPELLPGLRGAACPVVQDGNAAPSSGGAAKWARCAWRLRGEGAAALAGSLTRRWANPSALAICHSARGARACACAVCGGTHRARPRGLLQGDGSVQYPGQAWKLPARQKHGVRDTDRQPAREREPAPSRAKSRQRSTRNVHGHGERGRVERGGIAKSARAATTG